MYNTFQYNKDMYNSLISVVKRYLDITVKFVKGLISAIFYKRIGIDAMFYKKIGIDTMFAKKIDVGTMLAKKVEITTKFEGIGQ